MWNSFQHGGDPVILHMNGVMCNGAGAFLRVLWTHWVTWLMPALCLWNTLFGRRKQDVRNVQFLTQSTNSSLAACPWKSPSFTCHCEIHYRVFALFCMAACVCYTCPWVYVCVCVHLWWAPSSALDMCFHSFCFCPQVRVWLLITWATIILNLQRMIHNHGSA